LLMAECLRRFRRLPIRVGGGELWERSGRVRLAL
jgi:hypothetical protein